MDRRAFLAAPLAQHLDITKFGAAPGGDSRAPIQRAIDECAAQGGGMVRVPPGRFVTGTLRLKTGVALWLDHGAVLAGSANPKEYEPRRPTENLPPDGWACALILAEGAERCGLLGYGSITGGGLEKPRVPGKPREPFRPRLISFERCREVRVEGLTLRDADRWTLHFYDCDSVQARSLHIRAGYAMYNTDGIDVDGSRNVVISDCDILAGDDCIVLKTTNYLGDPKPCENITVTNCTLSTRASALKIGTETHARFHNITFSNCTVYGDGDYRPDAVCVEAVDGADLRNVAVSNIVMRHIRTPVFVRLGARGAPSRVENIVISNIVANDASVTCSITGIPDHPARAVTVSDLRCVMTGGGAAELADREVPEREAAYPKGDMFGELPSFGFYVRHAADVRLRNLSVTCERPDARPALIADDVAHLDVDGLAAPGPIWLKDTAGTSIRGHAGRVRVSGIRTARVSIRPPAFAAEAAVEMSPEVAKEAVRVTAPWGP